ncbi:proteasome subunit beta type-6 [Hibiscus syriacus]|uniref:Proteasome subunit beta type-6 n=1 Tax=Hibiscus syriacus TaxID=106335 RepID=A0A6A3A865_HIBSY|nr:protein SUPPRESSOR OF MAX2 1-like [Hibiscus syriacus]KAE8700146.1 proteasome subunit beta type-6 [Hibiscus syriacus]
MRAGLSTIQQTLTPEAASVLNHSIAEATRRNHGQTTPLHVAATLLASPSGFLRQACIKSHPNSSHPLQCRALELCFSVALERLPTAQNASSGGSPGLDPPISNALMAALKRAQAHQRRGCPEQQQQPLLAVKVELEQLIISILDDPSVSRVMREASFSSPAVKSTIEQSLSSTTPNSANIAGPIGLGFRPVIAPVSTVAAPSPNRNLYLNPRLQQGAAGQQRSEEVKRVIDILTRSKKMNPVLVGDSEPELIVKEILRKIESKEIDGVLRNVEVVSLEKDFALDKTQMVAKIKELGTKVGAMIGNLDCGGVILDLGDLKWLVENNQAVVLVGGVQQQQQTVSEAGRAAVVEMGKLLGRFGEGSARVWLIGTATCETYLRCQVYHPSMENDWGLQAVPIAARAPSPGMFSRLGSNGILGSSVESLSPLKAFATTTAQPRQPSENFDPSRKTGCCPQCMQNCKQDLAKLVAAKEFEQRSPDIRSESTRPALPQWLQKAQAHDNHVKTIDEMQTKDQDVNWTQKTQELQKKWNDTCLQLHPNFHQPSLGNERYAPAALPMMSLYNSSLLGRQTFQPKLPLSKNIGETLQLNPHLVASQPMERTSSPPGSPVKTDLVLGRPKIIETTPERTDKERLQDFLFRIPYEPVNKLQDLQSNKLLNALDVESFKKLLKGLVDKVWWQRDAASSVATTVTQCRLGNGKRRGTSSKGDIWLLFAGPDRVGKKKMALALSDQVCGVHPFVISLGSRRDDGESDASFRGKTVVDKIAEAVRRNPFSVVVLDDIDEADMLVRGSIKRAMERGRIADSHGREISLGNVIFILTSSRMPGNLNFTSNDISLDEQKLATLASGGWQLRLSLCEKTAKRRASWLHEEDRATKPRTDCGSPSFDLNEAAYVEEEKAADGSHNSSVLTVDHEEEHGLTNRVLSNSTSAAASHELLNSVDEAIVFKPVDFGPIRRDISNLITKKFCSIIGDRFTIEIVNEALEKITSGICIDRTGLEEWTEKALVPSLRQLKTRMPASLDSSLVFRLELDPESCNRSHVDWLPGSVKVVFDDGIR